MITSKVSVLAENVSVDRETNQVSAFNILDTIASPAFPLFLRQVVFYCVIERQATDPANTNLTFTVNLNGQQQVSNQQAVAFGTERRSRTYVKLNGFLIPAPGTIVFQLMEGASVIAEYILEVIQIVPPGGQMALVGAAPIINLPLPPNQA